eukprot:2129726-Prymnesium_polylepis.1
MAAIKTPSCSGQASVQDAALGAAPGVEQTAADDAARVATGELVEKAYSDAKNEAVLAAANLTLFDSIALLAEHHAGRPVAAPPALCSRLH